MKITPNHYKLLSVHLLAEELQTAFNVALMNVASVDYDCLTGLPVRRVRRVRSREPGDGNALRTASSGDVQESPCRLPALLPPVLRRPQRGFGSCTITLK